MKEIIEKHRKSVMALGYSGEQADDLIHRLSAIMSAFIDAAWGVHPAQLGARSGAKKSLPGTDPSDTIRTNAKQCEKEGSAAPLAEE